MVMEVEPGMWLQLQEEMLALEKYIADLQDQIAMLQVGIAQEANAISKAQLEFQRSQAEQELVFRREELVERRKETELRLATSPIDFVAYELYRRETEKKGTAQAQLYETEQAAALDFKNKMTKLFAAPAGSEERRRLSAEINAQYGKMRLPSGERRIQPRTGGRGPSLEYKTVEPKGYAPVAPPKTDEEIQAMIAALVGEGGGSLGIGEFGVDVPRTQAISRQEARGFSRDEMDILSSFLKAGFQANGQEVSYDPEDFWREVEEGFIPTIRTPAAQYSL